MKLVPRGQLCRAAMRLSPLRFIPLHTHPHHCTGSYLSFLILPVGFWLVYVYLCDQSSRYKNRMIFRILVGFPCVYYYSGDVGHAPSFLPVSKLTVLQIQNHCDYQAYWNVTSFSLKYWLKVWYNIALRIYCNHHFETKRIKFKSRNTNCGLDLFMVIKNNISTEEINLYIWYII